MWISGDQFERCTSPAGGGKIETWESPTHKYIFPVIRGVSTEGEGKY